MKRLDIDYFFKMLSNKYRKMKINLSSEFNQSKAIETILYLVKRIHNVDVYTICKLLYIVDKLSLENYGRFLFGESYCAMKEGAVPSYAYNLLKQARLTNDYGFKVKENKVFALREADTNLLSESDIDCLNKIISKRLPLNKLIEESHDEAWKKNWKRRSLRRSFPIAITDIASLLKDSNELIDYLSNCC